MFSSSSKNKNAAITKGNSGITILGPGSFFNGKVFVRGETRVGGQIEGQIVSEGILIIEETAQLKVEITGESVQVAGLVEGNINASCITKLTPKARIRGNIVTTRLIVEEGASIQGKVDITEQTSASNNDLGELREAAS